MSLPNTTKERCMRMKYLAHRAATALFNANPPNDRYANAITRLLLATWAHESNLGQYVRQIGFDKRSLRGAAGEFQMEFDTLKTCIGWLQRPKNHDLSVRVAQFSFMDPWPPENWTLYCDDGMECWFYELARNDRFAVSMARVKYLMVPEPIPETLDGAAAYAKKYWNTEAGAATADDYKNAYLMGFDE